MTLGNRILVIGCPGSGKSTLSVQLAQKTGLPLIHLDAVFWTPGWVEKPREQFWAEVEELAKGDCWIMDGNFSGTLPLRLARCDTVIWLDFKRTLCIRRIIKRVLGSYGRVRSDMGEGCPERFDFAFLRYVWEFQKKQRPKLVRLINGAEDKTIIILRHPGELEQWRAQLEQETK